MRMLVGRMLVSRMLVSVMVASAIASSASCARATAPEQAPPGMPQVGSPATPTGPTTAPEDHEIRVGLTEWSIEIAEDLFPAGTFRLVVTNTGATGHDLVVRGRGGVWGTPVIPPGQSAELEITAVAGETLEALCTVTGHHSAGMHRLVEVAGP